MSIKRVGIFGGTFNPPHLGHTNAAKKFVSEMDLDELIIIPTNIPPHKDFSIATTAAHRIQMCKLAFKDVDKAVVSDIEIRRGGVSYTYQTLSDLSSENVQLYFLCGTDMILSIDKWMHPEIIFNLANICYIRRENNREISQAIASKIKIYKSKFKAEIFEIVSDSIEVSSSNIRDLLNRSDESEILISDSVMQYIKDKGLYK